MIVDDPMITFEVYYNLPRVIMRAWTRSILVSYLLGDFLHTGIPACVLFKCRYDVFERLAQLARIV